MRHMRLAPLLAIAVGLAACSGGHQADNAAAPGGTGNEIGAVDETVSANEALPVDDGAAAAENAFDTKSIDGNAGEATGNAGEATTNAI